MKHIVSMPAWLFSRQKLVPKQYSHTPDCSDTCRELLHRQMNYWHWSPSNAVV